MGALNTHDFLREKVAEPLNALIAETTFAQIGKTKTSPPSGGRSTTTDITSSYGPYCGAVGSIRSIRTMTSHLLPARRAQGEEV